MSPTFHPAEENNLEPLKKNSADLLAKAQAWQNSTVPAGFKADVTKPILKRLVKQCKLVNKSVKAGKSDAELRKSGSQNGRTAAEQHQNCSTDHLGKKRLGHHTLH